MVLHRPYRALLIADLNNLGLTPQAILCRPSGFRKSELRLKFVKDVLGMNTLKCADSGKTAT